MVTEKAPHTGAMLDGDRVKVVLSLEAEGPIRGAINAASGAEQFFYGWMELAGAIDRARRAGGASVATVPVMVDLMRANPPGVVGETEPS